MTQPNVVERPSMNKPQHLSPILAIHRQYEAAMEAQHTLDLADMGLGKCEADQRLEHRYKIAMGAADAETDALRTAILYQVPATAEEALILQYHVWIAADLYGQEAPEAQWAAFLAALDILFDFHASETPDAETGDLGKQFVSGTRLAESRRRLRAGDVEGR